MSKARDLRRAKAHRERVLVQRATLAARALHDEESPKYLSPLPFNANNVFGLSDFYLATKASVERAKATKGFTELSAYNERVAKARRAQRKPADSAA